ncbi:unnamed protein product [Blepharisma stoltei]|uniref:Uncharacterized protein n=1 Tax=Blepharisma stoltei TaxID=1481888 RepID=A0AAU9JM68_9CILI|nr:unnamed protein product [Blepharisma stoltei]
MSRRLSNKRSTRDRSKCPDVRIIEAAVSKPIQILLLQIDIKEKELEKNFELKTIHELIALYSKAIESFEINEDLRFHEIQERMHKMLQKPQVTQALNPQKYTKKPPRPKPKLEIEILEEDDPDIIQKRINSERNRKIIDQGLIRDLEAIMDRSLNEKVNKISEIKIAYEVQMRELEGQGEIEGQQGLIVKVMEQMKYDMDEEIEKVSQELDLKRQEEIRKLREEYVKINM